MPSTRSSFKTGFSFGPSGPWGRRGLSVKIAVSANVIERTTRCQRQFSCLSGAVESLCEVEYVVVGELYCLKRTSWRGCSYERRFGDTFLCICPVRQEIYDRYGV
jgi:hypothetical protein